MNLAQLLSTVVSYINHCRINEIFRWPRAPKNTYQNVILKWSWQELRAVLYNYHPVTPSPVYFFQVLPAISLCLQSNPSPKQNTIVSLSLLCTLPIWQQTNSQFRAPVHTLVQESKLSGHLVSLTESFTHPWPSLAYCSPTSIHWLHLLQFPWLFNYYNF